MKYLKIIVLRYFFLPGYFSVRAFHLHQSLESFLSLWSLSRCIFGQQRFFLNEVKFHFSPVSFAFELKSKVCWSASLNPNFPKWSLSTAAPIKAAYSITRKSASAVLTQYRSCYTSLRLADVFGIDSISALEHNCCKTIILLLCLLVTMEAIITGWLDQNQKNFNDPGIAWSNCMDKQMYKWKLNTISQSSQRI